MTDFFGDEYFPTKSYIAFFDSDTMPTGPMTCQSYFDESGKPYVPYRADGLLPPWSQQSIQILRLAKQHFPERYRYTEEHLNNLKRTDFMMMFPIILPREVMVLSRQIVKDAFRSDTLEDAFVQWQDPSQFDFLGKLCYLLFQDKVAVLAVKATVNVEHDHFARHWQFMTAHVKVNHEHQVC